MRKILIVVFLAALSQFFACGDDGQCDTLAKDYKDLVCINCGAEHKLCKEAEKEAEAADKFTKAQCTPSKEKSYADAFNKFDKKKACPEVKAK